MRGKEITVGTVDFFNEAMGAEEAQQAGYFSGALLLQGGGCGSWKEPVTDAGKNPAGYFKKNVGHPLDTRRQRFQRMKALAGEFRLKDLCEAFDVSRSGYYAWLGHDRTPRARVNQELAVEIKRLFAANDGNYGSPRMTQALRQQQKPCNRKRVERLMREQGLNARCKKRFKVHRCFFFSHLPHACPLFRGGTSKAGYNPPLQGRRGPGYA